eukprot:364027-Chlamydomonas_euryale.AAC.1
MQSRQHRPVHQPPPPHTPFRRHTKPGHTSPHPSQDAPSAGNRYSPWSCQPGPHPVRPSLRPPQDAPSAGTSFASWPPSTLVVTWLINTTARPHRSAMFIKSCAICAHAGRGRSGAGAWSTGRPQRCWYVVKGVAAVVNGGSGNLYCGTGFECVKEHAGVFLEARVMQQTVC